MSTDDEHRLSPRGPQGIAEVPSLVLLHRMQSGETAARDELVRRYWPRLARWARGRLPLQARDLYDTTDLVQETFAAALPRLEEFQPEHQGALLAYLRVAVMNRIINLVHRADRRGQRVDPDSLLEDGRPSPLEQVMGREVLARYERALARLSPEDHHAIQVRIELELPYEEIVHELGKPNVVAARKAVSRALFRLAVEMHREAGRDAAE